MRRKTERKCFCSVHAKSFKTLQILSFFHVYNAAHETKTAWSEWLLIFINHMFYKLPEYHIYESFQEVNEVY